MSRPPLDANAFRPFNMVIADNRDAMFGLPMGVEWTSAYVFVILIFVMVFRPQGLIGEETREAG